jgi:hypothetical protein
VFFGKEFKFNVLLIYNKNTFENSTVSISKRRIVLFFKLEDLIKLSDKFSNEIIL